MDVVRTARRLASDIRPVVSSRAMLWSLAALVAVDLAFVLMHVANLLSEHVPLAAGFGDANFNIETDGGYSEHFEYAKTSACVLALLGCWAWTRQPIYASLAAVFAFVLVDNALQAHEALGASASALLQPARRLFENAPQALGEVAAYALLGPLVLGLIGLGAALSAARHRLHGLAFMLVLGALSVFGVGVDLLHAASWRLHRAVPTAFGLVEDGGELVILSVGCAFSIAVLAAFHAERRARREPRGALQPPRAAFPAVAGAVPLTGGAERAA